MVCPGDVNGDSDFSMTNDQQTTVLQTGGPPALSNNVVILRRDIAADVAALKQNSQRTAIAEHGLPSAGFICQ